MAVSAQGATILVTLPDEEPALSLYDLTGRCLQTHYHCRQACFTAPTPGVYLVNPHGGAAKRVVVK